MNAFFSDLDNTLIFSHRRRIRGSRIPVEKLDGKEQSYMTEHAFSFFQHTDWFSLIPVTTRSEKQYRRLLLPEAFRIQYALICNGGKLLVQGMENREWSEETEETVRKDLPELKELGEQLQHLCGHEIHHPESYYCYAKTEWPERICETLKDRNRESNILIANDRHKVYLFPQSINKGSAVRRFAKNHEINISIGAGDGIMDIPMLNEVDYPLAPEPVCGLICNPNTRQLTGEIFSDQICDELEIFHLQGII